MSQGLTGTYSTTLIKNMGFSSKKAALLNMPMGVVGIATNLIVGFGIRRSSNRWAWAVAVTIRKLMIPLPCLKLIFRSRSHWCSVTVISQATESCRISRRSLYDHCHQQYCNHLSGKSAQLSLFQQTQLIYFSSSNGP